MLGAPLTEEAAKGLFLLLMMTGRRRNELNSLTDCLVYAGLVGAGFAWLEDILYIGGGETLGDSLVTAAMRLIMAPFAHSLFTTMFGIGVYFALQQRNARRQGRLHPARLSRRGDHARPVERLVVARASRPTSASTCCWMVPIFGLAIVLGVGSRRREQRVVAAKLPGMVAAGLVTPNEATWLGSIRNRKAGDRRRRPGSAGRPAGKAVKNFAAQVVELAFVRDRIDRGFGDQRVNALLNEEAYGGVRGARGRARTAGPGRVPRDGASARRSPSCGRSRPTTSSGTSSG